jgi:hypothetical protein
MIALLPTWLAIHSAASAWGAGTAGEVALGAVVLLAGRGRAAGPPGELNAPLTARAVTATAAATMTAATTCQRLRSHSLSVVARTRPHDGAASAADGDGAGRTGSGAGFVVSLASSGAGFPASAAGSPAASGETTFTSMLPSDACPFSSLTVATLRYAYQRLTCHSRAHQPAKINPNRLLVMNA